MRRNALNQVHYPGIDIPAVAAGQQRTKDIAAKASAQIAGLGQLLQQVRDLHEYAFGRQRPDFLGDRAKLIGLQIDQRPHAAGRLAF